MKYNVFKVANIYLSCTYKLFLLCIFLALFACENYSGNNANKNISAYKITPLNKKVRYTGRLDWRLPEVPKITWPATQIDMLIQAKYLSVELKDKKGQNFFNVFIDNDFSNPQIIALKKGRHDYIIDLKKTKKPQRITITKRTEGQEGGTFLYGFNVNKQAKLFDLPARPIRKIEIFGDSVTSGMANEAALDAEDDDPADKNSFNSYGAITARSLNAEYHSTSQSGIGIMTSWFDYVMSDLFNQTDASWKNNTLWDFNQWQPDVVIINLFQNDSWLISKNLNPVPNENQIVQAYLNFISTLRDKYANAYIICTLGSMDITKPDSLWPGYVTRAVDQYRQRYNDNNIDTLFFPNEGYYKHPRVVHHKKNAALLTRFIQSKMKW